MSVGEICNREVVCAEGQLSVLEAARLMRQFHVGALVVLDDMEEGRRPVGIVTDRDIVVEVVAAAVAPEAVRVADVMTTQLLTAREEDTVWDTLQRMRAKGVRRAPVINSQGRLEGLVTVDDMLEVLAGELSDISRLVEREQEHERWLRR